jgi:hypothetical protein
MQETPDRHGPPRHLRRNTIAGGVALIGVILLLVPFISAASAAADAVPLGTAAPFAVLAATTVTNTGPSIIIGDLGLSPGTSVTGFPPGVVVGTQHVADAVALQAKTGLTAAYTTAASSPSTTTISANLGGRRSPLASIPHPVPLG